MVLFARVSGVMHPPPSNSVMETQARALAYEIPKLSKTAVGRPLFVEHDYSRGPIGKIAEIGVAPSGAIMAKVDIDLSKQEGIDALEAVKNGKYKCFSMGMKFRKGGDGVSLHDFECFELSLCEEGRLEGTKIVTCEDPRDSTCRISFGGLEVMCNGPDQLETMIKQAKTLQPRPSTNLSYLYALQRQKEALRFSDVNVKKITLGNLTSINPGTVILQASQKMASPEADQLDVDKLEQNADNWKMLLSTVKGLGMENEILHKKYSALIQKDIQHVSKFADDVLGDGSKDEDVLAIVKNADDRTKVKETFQYYLNAQDPVSIDNAKVVIDLLRTLKDERSQLKLQCSKLQEENEQLKKELKNVGPTPELKDSPLVSKNSNATKTPLSVMEANLLYRQLQNGKRSLISQNSETPAPPPPSTINLKRLRETLTSEFHNDLLLPVDEVLGKK